MAPLPWMKLEEMKFLPSPIHHLLQVGSVSFFKGLLFVEKTCDYIILVEIIGFFFVQEMLFAPPKIVFRL